MTAMNSFDYNIITFINQFARKSDFLDSLVNLFVVNNLLKGGVLAMVIWFFWFDNTEPSQAYRRQMLLATLAGTLIAMFLARVLVHELPYRTRPLYNKELHFVAPIADWRTRELASFVDISAMPSDTATLSLALAVGILLISRRVGLLVLAYVVLFICIPRIYLGIHNPTDLIAGGILGTTCVLLTTRTVMLKRFFAPLLTLGNNHPSGFYICLFIITSQVSSMFEELRGIMFFFFHTH